MRLEHLARAAERVVLRFLLRFRKRSETRRPEIRLYVVRTASAFCIVGALVLVVGLVGAASAWTVGSGIESPLQCIVFGSVAILCGVVAYLTRPRAVNDRRSEQMRYLGEQLIERRLSELDNRHEGQDSGIVG